MEFLIILLLLFLFYYLNKRINFLLKKFDLMIDDLFVLRTILENNSKEVVEVISNESNR